MNDLYTKIIYYWKQLKKMQLNGKLFHSCVHGLKNVTLLRCQYYLPKIYRFPAISIKALTEFFFAEINHLEIYTEFKEP